MSMQPGTSRILTEGNPVGDAGVPGGTAGPLTQSQTLNAPTRIEYGRTMSGGVFGDTAAGTELPA